MINVENVSFQYGKGERKILNQLSFSVREGEIIAIVGQNGSGKSTIGKLIAGIIKLKQGSITIDGLAVSDRKNEKLIHEKIGIVFQNPENQIIFNHIEDELSFSLKHLEKQEIETRINQALEQVEMLHFRTQDLYTLSLGQKQRMMIAEVLAKHPKYIILDEPTTMIDSEGKEKIYEIIRSLKKQGYTIICITNLADEILLADKTLILQEGKIVAEIEKQELIQRAGTFKQFGIKVPTILEMATTLKKQGVELNLQEFSVYEFINALKGKIVK